MCQENPKSGDKKLRNFFLLVHDIKSPINQVKGLLQIAKKTTDENELNQILELALQANEKLSEKVRLILEASLQSKKKGESNKKIDFNGMFENIQNSLSSMEGFDRTKIITRIPRDINFSGDSVKLQSVFQNLIENAIKYQNPNVGRNIIIIAMQNVKNLVMIKISDNGKGIKEDKLPFIFEKGYRINGAESGGHGMGLYLVKDNLKSIDGKIEVDSVEGEGTTFTITLPKCVL